MKGIEDLIIFEYSGFRRSDLKKLMKKIMIFFGY